MNRVVVVATPAVGADVESGLIAEALDVAAVTVERMRFRQPTVQHRQPTVQHRQPTVQHRQPTVRHAVLVVVVIRPPVVAELIAVDAMTADRHARQHQPKLGLAVAAMPPAGAVVVHAERLV